MDIVLEVNRAIEFNKQKQYTKAEKIYLDILKNNDKNAVILSLLGLLYMNWGKPKKAEKHLKSSYDINKNITAAEGLALLNNKLFKDKEAEVYFEEIIDKTKNFEVLDKYVKYLLNQKMHTKALKYAEKTAKLFPLKKECYPNLIESYISTGELKKAFDTALKAIQTYPKYGEGWLWFGLVQEIILHDDKEAEKCFKMALQLGNKKTAYYNLAINSYKQDNYKKADYYIKKYRKYEGVHISSNFTLSVINMKQRKFKTGLRYYYDYVLIDSLTKENSSISKLKRLWNGKSYKDKTIFIYGDQGIGDLFMFSRYLPIVSKKFKTVKVLIREPILELFKRSFKQYKNIKFYNYNTMKSLPRYDKSAILSCLPSLLKADYNKIPLSQGYFIPDEKLVDKYKTKMKSNKFRIGLCWEAGAGGWREQLNRTLDVAVFDKILNMKNVQFYSFQVNPSMDNYKDYPNLIDLGSDFKNFDDTAGALKNLDLLITVDTSVAHLAGGLGVKTFMLLPYCSDWRWFDDEEKTGWYDSIKIFKQKNPKSWDEVIKTLADEVNKLTH